jgi:hypothetical protein
MKRSIRVSLSMAAVLAAVAITTLMHTAGALYAQRGGAEGEVPIVVPEMAGSWQMTLIGNTGCGFTSMLVDVTLNGAGSGTVNTVGHTAGCADGQSTGNRFVIQTLNANGEGTANLSCGAGCGWEFNIQVDRSRQIFNLVDVDPANPGNFLEGTAIRQLVHQEARGAF